jgi:hypothetical protein
MKKVEVVQATTSHYYHVVPGELERVTLTPEKAAIFEYLSRIGSERFVEFVSDVLVHIEGHTLVDKTDGSGDEKQDILTLDPAGHRHLTQCKHTVNYGNNTSGDELDVMMSACLRKNCRSATWVTNADLTVQAKRYVNDGEYLRGWPKGAEFTPTVEYWNGERIWQRVARNGQILNKWFGGMAQSHGLRSFFTDIVILKMPAGKTCDVKIEDFAAKMKGANAVLSDGEAEGFSLKIDKSVTIRVSDSFATPADLKIPFSDPRSASMPLNTPFRALRVHASVIGDGVYDPDRYRDRVVAKLGDALPKPKSDSWWYIAAAAPQAFVFLQDVAKPVLVPIGNPKTFVRVGIEPTRSEQEWALDPGDDFENAATPEDEDELFWRHKKTRAHLHVLVDQALPAWRVSDVFLRQDQISKRLGKLSFWAIDQAQGLTIPRLRNLCPPDWPILQSSDGTLFWAHPPDKESEAVEMAAVLERMGIECLRVRDEDRRSIITQIAPAPSETGMITSSRGELLTPMRLSQRTFWLSDRIPFSGKLTKEQFLDLLELKGHYEEKHGYDFFHGKDSVTIAGEEIQRILGDLLTVRGKRMLDIGVDDKELLVNVRIIGDELAAGEAIAKECLREMALLRRQIEKLLEA